MQQPIVDMLVWMRVPGDTIFSVGALALAWFVLRLWVAPRRESGAAPAKPNRLTADASGGRRTGRHRPPRFVVASALH